MRTFEPPTCEPLLADTCPGDFDGSGTADITAFLSAWFAARAGGC